MPILLDVNSLPSIFDRSVADHADFAAVFECVVDRKVSIPIGGKKFREELVKMPKYLRLYVEFERKGQLIRIPDPEVDALSSSLSAKANDPDFDDEHLLALIILAKCRVVCTKDARAMKFIKMKSLYPKNAKRAAIYCRSQHAKLLRLV